MATLNGVVTDMISEIQSFESLHGPQIDAFTNTVLDVTPNIASGGINSTSAEVLNNAYGNFNSGVGNYESYYDNLLDGASTNKKFIETLQSRGVTIDNNFRKEISNYKQQYVDKILEEKSKAQSSFNNFMSDINSMVQDETGHTLLQISQHTQNRQAFIENTIDPQINQAVNLIDKNNEYAQEAAKQIQTTRQQYVNKLSNPNITQEEVKQTMKEFNKWTGDVQKGKHDATSNLIGNDRLLNQQKQNILNQLEQNGFSSKETSDLIDSIFNKTSEGYNNILGEGGELTQTAMAVNEQRLDAIHRITGTNQIPELIPDVIPEATPTPRTPRTSTPELVKGSRAHRLEGTPIKDSSVPKFRLKETEEKVIANMVHDGVEQLSPSNYLTAKNPERFELVNPKKAAQEVAEAGTKNISAKQLLKKHGLNSVINIGATLIDYKESRREGQGVLKSAAKAGVNFAIGETLGMAAIPFYLVGSLPSLAVKTVEGVNKMERQMNSVSRMQPFADTHFQDTQQLATMRQSGMEMAKMAQYNLQQTLMGTEATHLHR